MTPKVPTVNVIKTTNSLASQGSVNPEMMAQLPHNTVDDAVKTTNSLRSQYSVEVIDPEILTLLRHRFKKQGAENSICTEVVCLRCRPSTEILISSTFEKFTKFPLLPGELKIKIWKLAICPRVVTKHIHHKGSPKPIFTPGVPVLMHTCRDSREIALRHYSTAEAYRRSGNEDLVGPITLNFEMDTFLCLDKDPLFFLIREPDSDPLELPKHFNGQLRHLCINLYLFESILMFHNAPLSPTKKIRYIYFVFKRFEKLETLSLHLDFDDSLPAHKPWEAVLVDIKPETAFASYDREDAVDDGQVGFANVRTFDNTVSKRTVECYLRPLREVERAHPEWNAPELKFAQVQFVDPGRRCWS